MPSGELLASISEKEATIPYEFKITNIPVYSFEEALYHCYHYWRESVDDFTSNEFIDWVFSELSLTYFASIIKELITIESFSQRLIKFLTIIDYFNDNEICAIRKELLAYENRMEWEKLKERADFLMRDNQYGKAHILYKRALQYGENIELLNNLAISLLKIKRYKEAFEYFTKAYELNKNNFTIILNFSECAIYNHEFDTALSLLNKALCMKEDSHIYYLLGELNFEQNNFRNAVSQYEKAISLSLDPDYVFRLADAYAKLRLFDSALKALDILTNKNKAFLLKQAEIQSLYGNAPAAIKCMERALISHRNDITLWIHLAIYHRQDYDLAKAEGAINKALGIDPKNNLALLESARIQKLLGKTKDYQNILNNILNGFKNEYRQTITAL